MPKFKVLAVVGSEEMRLALRKQFSSDDEIAMVGFAAMDTAVLGKIAGYAPHVVLLAQEEGEAGVMEIAQRIYQGFPGCALVLLAHRLDMRLVRAAMEAGIRQVVAMDDAGSLKDAVIRAAVFEKGRNGETGREPRVIAVYGGKGGAGKTTVAVNLAVALAQTGRRTALVDLCLNYGDAALLLNITARDTIAELVQDKSIFSIDDVKSFSIQHSSGVSVLCSPASPEHAEYITPRHVETLIGTIRPYYDFVVIDLPGNLSECTLTALENSDDILMVSRMDISNLHAAKQALGIFRTLQQEEKLVLLLNAEHKGVLKRRDFEQVLEQSVLQTIPEDAKTARLSQERGVPFVIGMPRTPIAQGVRRLADRWLSERLREGA